ncbi:MAG: WXG100 family type VII secretion target [Lachnospiraceae bacterium]|nr:WXG100 family type VII secretion target [Lachnospiraceae bacterium]
MAGTLMLDYDAISQEATKLQTEGDTMSDCIDKITNIVNGLPDIWQADTGTKYVEQYNELEPSLREAVQLIDDMVTQMNQISTNFQDTDSGMAGQM